VHLAAPSSQSAGGVGTHLGTGLHELSARLQNQDQDPGPQVDPDELMVYGDDSLPPHKLPPGPARTFSRGVGVQADEREVVEADRRPSVRRDARPNRERHRSNQRRAQRSRGQPGSDHMYQTQLGRDSDAHSGDSRDSLRARMEEVRYGVRCGFCYSSIEYSHLALTTLTTLTIMRWPHRFTDSPIHRTDHGCCTLLVLLHFLLIRSQTYPLPTRKVSTYSDRIDSLYPDRKSRALHGLRDGESLSERYRSVSKFVSEHLGQPKVSYGPGDSIARQATVRRMG